MTDNLQRALAPFDLQRVQLLDGFRRGAGRQAGLTGFSVNLQLGVKVLAALPQATDRLLAAVENLCKLLLAGTACRIGFHQVKP